MILRPLLAAALVAVISATPAAADEAGAVVVEVSPADVGLDLGGTFDVTITVTNHTQTPTAPLVVHIDVTDPSSTTSVDPEDWTPALSQVIGTLDPGDARVVTWSLQPVSAGEYALYAVALSRGSSVVVTSDAVGIRVEAHRAIDPGGVLPVVVIGPLVTGAFLALVLRRTAQPRGKAASVG